MCIINVSCDLNKMRIKLNVDYLTYCFIMLPTAKYALESLSCLVISRSCLVFLMICAACPTFVLFKSLAHDYA